MRVAIIGGGITGLTTALALHKVGIAAVVYEKATKLNEIGAGIWLQPNALQVLDWLGIKEDVVGYGMPLNTVAISSNQMKPFQAINEEAIQESVGTKTVALHRGKLQRALFDAASKHVEIVLDSEYISHHKQGDSHLIRFVNKEVEADIILGADGINSLVRKQVFPSASIRSSGQICWRGISNFSLPAEFAKIGQECWGDGIRFGLSQISDNEVYWFAVAKEKEHPASEISDLKTYLSNLFRDFHPLVKRIFENTDANKIHQAILSDLKRMDSWHKGNVCLLGDAAHATTPNMGQGACQGMEDAYYLANYLVSSLNVPAEGFAAFEKSRRKKVDFIVNNSWRFGKMAHHKVGQVLMKTVMKLTPEKAINASMDKLYALAEFDKKMEI